MKSHFDNAQIRYIHFVMAAFWFIAAIGAKAMGHNLVAVFILLPVGLVALGLAFTTGTKTIGELKRQLGLV